jgi:hypothetical protein
LSGISKIGALKEIGHKINHYYFLMSEDAIFNSFDAGGNHIEDLGFLNKLRRVYIPKNIIQCIIPNSVTNICDYAFYCCTALKEITIPNSVTSIGNDAFSFCKSLKEITIPDSVTSIDDWAFWNCKSLKEIIFKGKTLNEVKRMENYPFGIADESIIKFS